MTDNRIIGFFIAVFLVGLLFALTLIDKHYLNSWIANRLRHPKLRVFTMILIAIMAILSSIFWKYYIAN